MPEVLSLAGIPWRVWAALPAGHALFRNGVLYADSVDTVRKLVAKLNEICMRPT